MPLRYLAGSLLWLSALSVWAQAVPSPDSAGHGAAHERTNQVVQAARPTNPIRYEAEIGGLAASTAQTPFWLRSNQYNTVPLRGSFGTFRFGLVRDYKPRPDSVAKRKNRFDWGVGLSTVVNVGPTSTSDNPAVLLPDAYVKVRFGKFELYGGNRREVAGLGDTLLTSGFVAWSGNAMPFPKIQLHTPDFVSIGFTKQLLAFRVGYAHGWLIDSYIQGSYLHQKYLYGRLGKPTWRVRFYGGLNHQVQWGGRATYLIGTDLAVNGSLPSSVQDYLSLVLGTYPDALENDRFTDFDGTNRIGNHVGNYDMAVEWNGLKSNWLLYHQHLYDDASGLAFQNVPDGLTGLRYLNRSTTSPRFRFGRIVLEWLTTMDQSGPTFDPKARWQGADNYFNNSQYIRGWSYRGRTIGTPFMIPRTDLSQPVNNDYPGGGFYPNNRLRAWYVSFLGVFRRGPALMGRLAYSRNVGTYNQPYPVAFAQLSAFLSAQWTLSNSSKTVLTTSLALDGGELLPRTVGAFISLKKSW